jgi:ferredoxin
VGRIGRHACVERGAIAKLAETAMAYVVTEPCIRCKYTDCAAVCPVSCFHEGPNFLVIDPEECIDCDICVPECPVDAIYPEDQVPPDQQEFVALNAELAKAWPVIDTKKDAPSDAAAWVGVKVKRRYLQR